MENCEEPKKFSIVVSNRKNLFRRIWLIGIKLKWNKLWIRKNEFHNSLNIDGEAMFYMNEKQRERYINDLVKRRNIAHERDLN